MIWIFKYIFLFLLLENFIVVKNMYHKMATILAILNAQFNSIKFIHIGVKQSPRTFLSYPIETLYPLNNSPQRPSQALATTILPKNLTTLDTSYKCNCIVFDPS